MSIQAMSMVFKRYANGGAEKLLALALADEADDSGGRIFPSVETLAVKSSQSARSVQRQLLVMLESGWLLLVRKSSGRRGDCNEYRISPEWMAGGEAIKPVEVPDRRTSKTVKQFEGSAGTGDSLSPVNAANEASLSVDKLSTTGDTQGLSGDTQGLSGDTAMSPNPLLPLNTLKPPLPPVDTGGGVEDKKTEQPQSSETKRIRETKHGFKAPWRWSDRRVDIERVGEALGLGRWDETAFGLGRGELFSAYEARVRRAYDAQSGEARAAHTCEPGGVSVARMVEASVRRAA